MAYSPDISGFPYWTTEAQEKREEVWEKGWEQGKCDQMDYDDNRDDAIKKLKKEKKSIKGEKKYLAKKVPKMREEIKVIKDRLHWRDKEIKAYEKGAQNSGQIAIAQGEKIKELDQLVVKGDAAVEALKFMGYKYNNGSWEEEEEEEEDPEHCCESCGKGFDLAYTMNHADKELRAKYDKYMGSPEDDGDRCSICMDSEEQIHQR